MLGYVWWLCMVMGNPVKYHVVALYLYSLCNVDYYYHV